jgi:AraC-like DNA-binding protein
VLDLRLQGVACFRPREGRLELPDTCCDLTLCNGRLFLSGPLTRARRSPYVDCNVTLLKLATTAARDVLGVPISELTDRVLPLELVNANLALSLARRAEQGGWSDLVAPMPLAGTGAQRLAAAAAALRRGASVGGVARDVGLSERQLERLFHERAGLAPKTYARIARFRATVLDARAGESFAAAAATHRYADQAHFNRDVRALTGRAPTALLPDVGSVQDLVAGRI